MPTSPRSPRGWRRRRRRAIRRRNRPISCACRSRAAASAETMRRVVLFVIAAGLVGLPFASYTQVTRADSDAIFAYLMSVPPVRQENRKHELRFPFNKRELLLGWRTLYFKEGEFVADPKQSAQWNRGAYLVEGLGHCSM